MAVERKLIRDQRRRMMVQEFVHRETERAGFGGVQIQRHPTGTRVRITVERPGFVIGRRGTTIKRLTEEIQNRFALDNPQIEVQEDPRPSLNAQIMAQKLAEALERGWHFRRAGHATLRRIMEAGARGALVIIGGKLTGGRSRREKFKEGRIKFTGETALRFMDTGFAVAKKKLGTIGVTVKIMKPEVRMPDEIQIRGVEAPSLTPTEAAPPVPQPVEAPTEPPTPRRKLGGHPTDIPGVGKQRGEALEREGFHTLDDLDEAAEEDIAEVVGPKIAQNIKEYIRKLKEG